MMANTVGDLIYLFILSSIGIILLLIFKKTLFKRYSKTFNYTIWLFVILRMLLPLKFNIDITSYVGNHYTGSKFILDCINFITSIEMEIRNFKFNPIISGIWVSGVIVFGPWKVINYIYIKKRLINISARVKDKRVLKIYNNLLKEVGITKKITLIKSGDRIPFGIGIVKSYIVLPNIQYNEKELKWILRHELTHFKYHDILYKTLLMFLTTIYWFDPFVYIMNNVINNECELACDERVLKNCKISLKREYALTILNSVESLRTNKNEMILTALGKKKFIKDRIESMFVDNLKKGIITKVIIFILVFMTVFGIELSPGKNYKVNNGNSQSALYLYDFEEKSDY